MTAIAASVGVVIDPTVEALLWTDLRRAAQSTIPGLASHAEDAVFRYYRPLAVALAELHCPGRSDPAVLEAAENALAAAVLQWSPHRADGFLSHAEHAILTRVRRRKSPIAQRRFGLVLSHRSPPLGQARSAP